MSPSPMARAVVLKAARMGRKTAVLVRVVRSILMFVREGGVRGGVVLEKKRFKMWRREGLRL